MTIFLPGEVAPGETREPETNRWGQFRIKCPDGKARWYTRCTTFIDCLSERTLLEKWKQRVLLIGVDRYLNGDPRDRDLVWPGPDPDDRDGLNALADELFELGDGFLKSRKGTSLHALTQAWDGYDSALPEHDETDARDLAAWIQATSGPRFDGWLHRETRVVIDGFKVTGTPDGIVRYKCLDGRWRNVIADLKTGSSVSYDSGKHAMQEAMYAAGELYTDDGSVTGKREPLPDVSREIGLLIHVPQGEGRASVYELDLILGWRGIGLASQVREWRNYSKRVLHEVPL